MTDYVIRKAVSSDAHMIAEIEKECIKQPWSENLILSEINDPQAIFIVYEISDSVVAYVSGRNIVGEFYVNNIAVTPKLRRKQIAEKLMNTLIKYAEDAGCEFITLEVRKCNLPARQLYHKCDFSEIGIRPGYYKDPPDDAVIYTIYFRTE